MRRAAIAIVVVACGGSRPAPAPTHLEHTADPEQPPPAQFAALFDPARTWTLPETIELDGNVPSRATVTCRVTALTRPAPDTWQSKIACDRADPRRAGMLPSGTYIATLHGLWRFPGEVGALTDDAMLIPTPPVPSSSKTTRTYEDGDGIWCNQQHHDGSSTIFLCISARDGLVRGGGTVATEYSATHVTWGEQPR